MSVKDKSIVFEGEVVPPPTVAFRVTSEEWAGVITRAETLMIERVEKSLPDATIGDCVVDAMFEKWPQYVDRIRGNILGLELREGPIEEEDRFLVVGGFND